MLNPVFCRIVVFASDVAYNELWREIRAPFFDFLFLAYSGVLHAAGEKKTKKKHTEHERMHFFGTTEHESNPYTHAHCPCRKPSKAITTQNTRCATLLFWMLRCFSVRDCTYGVILTFPNAVLSTLSEDARGATLYGAAKIHISFFFCALSTDPLVLSVFFFGHFLEIFV